VSAVSFRVKSRKVILAVEPSLAAVDKATVNVTVTTPEGTSPISPADEFSYQVPPPMIGSVSPKEGKAAGGTTVIVDGANFIEVTAVHFGSLSATEFTVNSAGSITATSPAETVGKVPVTVATLYGTSGPPACRKRSERFICPPHEFFSFVEPTITSVTPNTGPTTGGTVVTITGTGFGVGTTATAVRFDRTPAVSVDCVSITTCTVVTPAHRARTVNVRAAIVDMRSTKENPADLFTYE
jgi:hypothetical protein